MPRGRKPEPLWDPIAEWKAARDLAGLWHVVNGRGERILQHPDPLVRLQAVHLAASAPLLRELLRVCARRIVALNETVGIARDLTMAREAMIVIGESRPNIREVIELQRREGQLELVLDAEEAPGIEAAGGRRRR